jgi:hypothetical protein
MVNIQLVSLFLPVLFWSPFIPIHFIIPENIQWLNYNDPEGLFTLEFPEEIDWKIERIENQNPPFYDQVLISHVDISSNVQIMFKVIPLDDINGKHGFPLFNSYSSYANALIDQLEVEIQNSDPTFQLVEKHSDKYLIDGHQASGILSRHSHSLGNTTGMLNLYAIDKTNDLLLMYKYNFDANSYIPYLPIAEKILDSIKINKIDKT